MPIIGTQTGRTIFKKPSSLWILPYKYDSTISDYVLGNTVYDISAIIGDTISYDENDGETSSKYNEFVGEPIITNTTSGSKKLSAQCLDLQNNILKVMFGALYNTEHAVAALRRDYEPLYALIRLRFTEQNVPDVYFPMVALNSKMMMQQLKSRGAQGNLNGVVESRRCAVVDTEPAGAVNGTLVGLQDDVNNETKYSVITPMLFVPKESKVLITHHYDSVNRITKYDEIKRSAGENEDICYHNRIVDDDNQSEYYL